MRPPATHRPFIERVLYVYIIEGDIPLDRSMSLKNLSGGIPTANDSLSTLLYNAVAFIFFAARRYAGWFRMQFARRASASQSAPFLTTDLPGIEALVCYVDRGNDAMREASSGYPMAAGAARVVMLRYLPIGTRTFRRSTILKRHKPAATL